MTADRDAVYDESTDEESENLPDPSVLAPGKRYTFITFVEYFTWLITLMIINCNEKCYEKNLFREVTRVASGPPILSLWD